MIYIIIGLLVVSATLTAIIIVLSMKGRSYRKELNTILTRLDLAIAGTQQETVYDESVDSAITEKLNQLVTISRLNCEDANKDRDLAQSLISDISHQVRTPLTNIMLYAGILGEKTTSDEDKKMAMQIQRQSAKLDFFMKELVRSSYLETEIISVCMETNPIDELIAEACQAVELAALKKQICFQVEECNKTGKFDLKWTREALVNVLDNAIKYSPDSSTITVLTAFYDNFFNIQVTDQGIGIEESEQGAVFKRFYRSPSVETEPGLGIGLYLVREIIEKQNGYVKVKSVLEHGTTFFIYLPNNR